MGLIIIGLTLVGAVAYLIFGPKPEYPMTPEEEAEDIELWRGL